MKQMESIWMPSSTNRVRISPGQWNVPENARTGTVSVQSGLANGAGDQGIMVGYACDETPQLMPMPVVLANRIVRELSASRRSGYIMGILPDGKAQVTVEYEDDRPVRLDTVVVSCQHEKEKIPSEAGA